MPSLRARRSLLIAAFTFLLPASLLAQSPDQKPPRQTWLQRFIGIKPDLSGGWLFVGFKSDSRDGLYFAVSKDGYRWETINFDRPVLWQQQRGELMRDPLIQRAPDGSFRLRWTWSQGSPALLGYSTSTDLIHWSKQLQLPEPQAPSARMTQMTQTGPEGAAVIQVAGGYLSYHETSGDPQHYVADFSADRQHWSDASSQIVFPSGLRHGSILRLETSEYNLLLNYHGAYDSAFDK